ncbi:MAG: AI-2E family transporter [Lachnospiraceae bacterium]|nr:AI-2E family transporter [Lachnospiraceae bacterium]
MEENKDKKVNNGKGFNPEDWNIRPYLAIGAVSFLVFCCCVIVLFCFVRFGKLSSGIGRIFKALMPFIVGFIFAYLLNPLMKVIDARLNIWILPRLKNKEAGKKRLCFISSLVTVLIFILVIALVISMMAPTIKSSFIDLISTLNEKTAAFLIWLQGTPIGPYMPESWDDVVLNSTEGFTKWVTETAWPVIEAYIGGIRESVKSLLSTFYNIIMGFIVAIYLLSEKEHLIGIIKKILYAVFPGKTANGLMHISRKCDRIFGGFIMGKIIDSIIIGILCGLGCAILKIPYALLVGVVIGFTNIIPFFGPFIGAIPCFIVILITEPIAALYFAIFILVLQQIDGNFIGPKVLGETIGITPFWIVFSVTVAGSLFGFWGMLLGVPVVAVIYYLFSTFINMLLRRKNLTTDTSSYAKVSQIDEESGELKYDDIVHVKFASDILAKVIKLKEKKKDDKNRKE